MTDKMRAFIGVGRIDSMPVKGQMFNGHRQHIASTPEGCQISRDEEIGFIVACGDHHQGQRHVPTLSAAYAICQQLMPRKPLI